MAICTIEVSFADDDKTLIEIPITLKELEGGGVVPPSINDVFKAIKDSGEFGKISTYVQEHYKGQTTEATVEDILKETNPRMGNITIDELQKRFATAEFPKNLSKPPIVLFVDSLKIGGHYLSGRFINNRGQEMFIIENNEKDVRKFAKFLATRELLETSNITFKDDDKNILRKIQNSRTKKTGDEQNQEDDSFINTLLLDFLENSKNFKNLYYRNGKGDESAFVYLDKVTRMLAGKNLRRSYDDPLTNTIYQFTTWKLDDKKDWRIFLAIEDLARIFSKMDPNLIKNLGLKQKDITRQTLLSKDFKTVAETEKEGKVDIFPKGMVQEGDRLIDVLFRYLTSRDWPFNYVVKEVFPKTIEIEEKRRTVMEEFQISYDKQIFDNLLDEDYKGFKIYSRFRESENGEKGKEVFFYSQSYVTPKTKIQPYNTLEEAKTAIDKMVLGQKLNTARINFNHRGEHKDKITKEKILDTSKYISKLEGYKDSLPIKSIISVPDIQINKNAKFPNSWESTLVEGPHTYNDFLNYIDSWEQRGITKDAIIRIKEIINNGDKAALYLYYINNTISTRERTADQQEALVNAAEQINDADLLHYYVTDGWATNHSSNVYTFIPVEPNEIKEAKSGKPTVAPLTRELLELSSNLEKLGVTVHLISDADLVTNNDLNQIKGINRNTTRAFIYNGDIYVNTTVATTRDLLHEYNHIFLGILKALHPERYEQLLYQYHESLTAYELGKIARTYEGLSEIDQLEESFANKFAEHVLKHYSNDGSVFQKLSDDLQKTMNSIFSNDGINIDTAYNGTASEIFKRLSHDIAMLLDDKDTMDSIDFNTITQNRKTTNIISEMIKANEIIQDCK